MPKNEHRQNRVYTIIAQAASAFISYESTNQSLITLTRVAPAKDGRSLTLLIGVLPETQEAPALSFLNRHKHDLFEYIKRTTSLDFIPKIEFAIDSGEKNRQRIDELVADDEQL
ncbi:MAG: ribosome-binding factor A [bacterium]|nr:ribosome-binding factor A [bacterium]